MSRTISDYKRIQKARTSYNYILDAHKYDDGYEFFIINENKKEYTISLYEKIQSNGSPDYIVQCSCPDSKYRKIKCKHIYWLGYKELDMTEPEEWTSSLLDFYMYTKRFTDNDIDEFGRQNTVCGICYADINYSEENVTCCDFCENCVHRKCWGRHVFRKQLDLKPYVPCIYCREYSIAQYW